MYKLLFIDDEPDFAAVISKYLDANGFNVDYAQDSMEGINKLENNNYDIVLCDLNLEKINGNQMVEIVKQNNPQTKAVLFTCSTDKYDELAGFRAGVDDYITKDDSLEILVARLQRLSKQDSKKIKTEIIESPKESILIDNRNRIVKKNDSIVELTKLEFDLLAYIIENKNTLLSREQIYEDVWAVPLASYETDLRNIDAHIKNIRKKLSISSIVSIRGIGYRWNE